MINRCLLKIFAVVIGVLMTPSLCLADVAAVAMVLPLAGGLMMVYSFIFIVLIEAIIIGKILNKIKGGYSYGSKQILKYSIIANLATTLIGLPVSVVVSNSLYTIVAIYALLDVLSAVIWIPVILFIFEFFISVFIETKIAYRFFKNARKEYLRKAIWIANIVSYLFLILFTIAWDLSIVLPYMQ